MMNQFFMDLKKEQSLSPQISPILNGKYQNYNYHSKLIQENCGEVLDLSRRRDSVETRTTPSPYNISCEENSPNHRHPLDLTAQTGLSNLGTTLNKINYPASSYFNLQLAPSSYPSSLQMKSLHKNQESNESNNNTDIMIKQQTFNVSDDIRSETSSSIHNDKIPMKSSTRPFKTYPRDPTAIATYFAATDASCDPSVADRYAVYRKRIIDNISSSSAEQQQTVPKIRRTNIGNRKNTIKDNVLIKNDKKDDSNDTININDDKKQVNEKQNGVIKDAAYYERRRKNNAAAQKSRQRRKEKEDDIAIRAAFLEREHIELRIELAALRKQLTLYKIEMNT